MAVTDIQLETLYLAYFGRPAARFVACSVSGQSAFAQAAARVDNIVVAPEPVRPQCVAHERAVAVLGPRRGRWK